MPVEGDPVGGVDLHVGMVPGGGLGPQILGPPGMDEPAVHRRRMGHIGQEPARQGIRLGLDQVQRQRMHPVDAERVLYRDRRDRRRGIAPEQRHRLQIGLQPGPAAGVGPGNDQDASLARSAAAHAGAPENSFNPTIPATIRTMQTMRAAVAGSP